MDSCDIDFVLPWVDGANPAWKALYDLYSSQEEKDFNKYGERFRDYNLLRFWFRGVEKNAPWVRKIHFVTCGHYPPWLDLNHPKIHFVKHSDYIPSRYLPTFSSHVIENNVHRIDGLADHFVLFNDDIYLSATVCPEDFFKHGLPRDVGVRHFIELNDYGHIDLNNISLVNRHLSYWKTFKKSPFKWFNYRYGVNCLRNVYFLGYRDFIGIKHRHLANSYLKSTYQKVWESCADALEDTNTRRFRSVNDVNQWLFQYWQLASGQFYPKRFHFGCFCLASDIDLIERILSQKRKKLLCINDVELADISALKQDLFRIFNKEFPEKSGFELF